MPLTKRFCFSILSVVQENTYLAQTIKNRFLLFGIFQTNWYVLKKKITHKNMKVIGTYSQKIKSIVFQEQNIRFVKHDYFNRGALKHLGAMPPMLQNL